MSDKTERTMRYRPDRIAGSTASEKKPVYYYKVFEGGEVELSLKDGWYVHPDKFPKEVKKESKKETKKTDKAK